MRPWYVAKLRPGAMRRAPDAVPAMAEDDPRHGETIAERFLRDAGIDVYLPRLRKEFVHHRSKRRIVRAFALFPGYAFVSVPHGRWGALYDDPSGKRAASPIAYVLGAGSIAWALDGAEIEALRSAEEAMAFDDTRAARIRRRQEGRNQRETVSLRYPPGISIRIVAGPFQGLSGSVADVTSRGTIRALLRLFGTLQPVEVPVDNLAAAE